MPSVRVIPQQLGPVSDNPSQAQARVALKLQALAYAGVRCGADASPDLVGRALASLCGASIAYVQAMGVEVSIPDTIAPTQESTGHLLGLQAAAVAYAAARHGSDACAQFHQDALCMLCQRAAEYAESLPGAARRGPRVDHTLALDRG